MSSAVQKSATSREDQLNESRESALEFFENSFLHFIGEERPRARLFDKDLKPKFKGGFLLATIIVCDAQ